MDEFFNNSQNQQPIDNEPSEAEFSPEVAVKKEGFDDNNIQQNTDGSFSNEAFSEAPKNEDQYTPLYNPINYSPVNKINDYKPMSKGLKLFTVLLAAIILLTGSCAVGYFLGKNSVKISNYKKPSNIELASTPKDTDQLTPAQVYEKVNKSVVGIIVYNTAGQSSQATGVVLTKDGYIVTNDHIYSEVPLAKFKVYTFDGNEYDATYVAGDVISDLAVLKVSANNLIPAEFGDSDQLFYGQNVVAIGRPSSATEPSSITNGIISGLNRRVQTTSSYSARLIQTDSAINPGSSGGALSNMYGQIIGITSSKLASVSYDDVGYAIPTTVMKRITDELISEGKVVSRAKLGITYTAIDSVTAELKGYKHVGLYIASVAEDSGLYGKAFEGDIITHINDIPITTDSIVLDIIEQSHAGDKITVTIVTKSGTSVVEAELKANIGESSYSTEIKTAPPANSNGGTFNFPDGE